MPTLVSCPGCGISGNLPDDAPGGFLGCPRCGARFATPDSAPLRSPEGLADGLSVWVGAGTPDQTPPPRRGLSALPESRAAEERPIEVTEENAAAHLGWLRQETRRFNDFVALQFEQIHRAREEATLAAAQAGAASVVREQELNRERANLAVRVSALDQREEELATRRAELERRLAEFARGEEDLRRRLEEADEIEEGLRAELEELEREVESSRRTVEEEARRLRSRPTATADNRPPDSTGFWLRG